MTSKRKNWPIDVNTGVKVHQGTGAKVHHLDEVMVWQVGV
jgi:hypothetical protein